MKVHRSCVQELHSLFVRAGTTCCDIDTVTLKSRSGRKRTRKLPTAYFATSGLASPRHAIVSKCAGTLFPFCCFSDLCKPKLSNRGIRRSFSCSPNDADRVEAKLQDGSDENPVPLTYADSNLEQEVERFDYGEATSESESQLVSVSDEEDGFRIQIVKLGKRSRRVKSSILINASLSTIWEVLTDYERLADFIPGLAVSRLLDKGDKYARLFQIGQQDLALGLKFNAKVVLDCYEKDLEILSYGQRRDIEFKMVEGDFATFQGRWSIVQKDEGTNGAWTRTGKYVKYDAEMVEAAQAFDILEGQEFQSTLFYEVELEPKLWLPVRLVEGRICKEIKKNLSSIRQEAHVWNCKFYYSMSSLDAFSPIGAGLI
ncbi:hypothetical protein Cgig2_032905 [Carnegiea gigantea]|uniref:Coenzyme Q-binding protein COQ10 START domain-containing protein n=1 Tax=Carnegiea gigantea TaxID=171969 RepID=A0A9Q1GML9_9CARY|nr:hypothetical protein Cgig2_032905 [Carnegiea gigantea]